MLKEHLIVLFFLLSNISFAQWPSKTYKTTDNQNKKVIKNNIEFNNLFFEGLNSKSLEDYREAVKYFEKCIQLNKNISAPHYEAAIIYKRLDKHDLAIEKIKQAILLEPKNRWYVFEYAKILFENQEFKNAAIQYKKLITIEPGNEELYFLLADTYIYQNQLQKAINVYDDLEKHKGIEESLSIQKHKLYMQLQKKQSSIKELKKLLKKSPNNFNVMEILAETYLLNDQKKEAFEIFKKIAASNIKKGRIHLTLAEHYRQEGDNKKSFEELILAFKSSELNIDTKIRVLASYFQIIHINNEIKDQAYQLSKILIDIHHDDVKAYAVYADVLYTDNRFLEAKEQYMLALTKDKNKAEIWSQILFIQAEENDFKEMLTTSEEALSYFPMDPLFYYFNGISNKWIKNYEKAILVLTTGIDFVINNDLLLLEFYSSMADSYHAIKKHTASDSLYEIALDIDSNNTLVLNNYAYYLSLRKIKLQKAMKMSLKANIIEENNGTYQDTYAWILYQNKEYKKAEKWILKSLENGGKESPVIIEHYGDILYKTGNKKKAFIQWEKAAKMGAESELLKKKIQEKTLYE